MTDTNDRYSTGFTYIPAEDTQGLEEFLASIRYFYQPDDRKYVIDKLERRVTQTKRLTVRKFATLFVDRDTIRMGARSLEADFFSAGETTQLIDMALPAQTAQKLESFGFEVVDKRSVVEFITQIGYDLSVFERIADLIRSEYGDASLSLELDTSSREQQLLIHLITHDDVDDAFDKRERLFDKGLLDLLAKHTRIEFFLDFA